MEYKPDMSIIGNYVLFPPLLACLTRVKNMEQDKVQCIHILYFGCSRRCSSFDGCSCHRPCPLDCQFQRFSCRPEQQSVSKDEASIRVQGLRIRYRLVGTLLDRLGFHCHQVCLQ